MSDIQDLIHKTSMDCLERGKIVERERIIKLLEEECAGDWPKVVEMSLANLIALIKGEK